MEFSSNRLKQVQLQMYNILDVGMLLITVLFKNHTNINENSTVRELSLHWAEMNKLNPILS